MKKLHVNILAAILTALGIGIFAYKAIILEFPLVPDTTSSAWIVEAHLSFYAQGKPAKVELLIPKTTANHVIVDENFISRGYGLSTRSKDLNRQAQWTLRRAVGSQSLYYRAVVRHATAPLPETKIKVPEPSVSSFEGAKLEAAKAVVAEVQTKSADIPSFIAGLIKEIMSGKPDSNIQLLLGKSNSNLKRAQVVAQLLKVAQIEARVVHGVMLVESFREAPIEHRIEAFYNQSWKSFDLLTGEEGVPDNFLSWWRGEDPIAQVDGGERVVTTVSIERYQEEGIAGAIEGGRVTNPILLEFSLFRLPIETQQVYRIILLIPIGALILVLIRNLIGFKTFGTFMPVLVALAFRETELLWGLALFTILVGFGLVVRFYLERLKLLLVPRLAAILTIVVLAMVGFSVFGHKLGIERGLSVALFPMVIITMTIERMSIVWEELGASNALRQAVGTLFSAILVYLVISSTLLQHLIFVFPELLLIVVAINLELGRYAGYRLLELLRFRALAEGPK